MNIGIACFNITREALAFLFESLLLLPQWFQFLRFNALNLRPGVLALLFRGVEVSAALPQPFLQGVELEQANAQLTADQQKQAEGEGTDQAACEHGDHNSGAPGPHVEQAEARLSHTAAKPIAEGGENPSKHQQRQDQQPTTHQPPLLV